MWSGRGTARDGYNYNDADEFLAKAGISPADAPPPGDRNRPSSRRSPGGSGRDRARPNRAPATAPKGPPARTPGHAPPDTYVPGQAAPAAPAPTYRPGQSAAPGPAVDGQRGRPVSSSGSGRRPSSRPRPPAPAPGPAAGGFTTTVPSLPTPGSAPAEDRAPAASQPSSAAAAGQTPQGQPLHPGAFTVTPNMAAQYQAHLKSGAGAYGAQQAQRTSPSSHQPPPGQPYPYDYQPQQDSLPAYPSDVGSSYASTRPSVAGSLASKAGFGKVWSRISGAGSTAPSAASGDSPAKGGHPGLSTIMEDEDPVLGELNETRPSFLASIVAKWPLLSMLLLLLGILGLAAPALALPQLRPKLNLDFEVLLIKDDVTTKHVAAIQTIDDYNDPFWNSDKEALALQRLNPRTPTDQLEELNGSSRRRLLSDDVFEVTPRDITSRRLLVDGGVGPLPHAVVAAAGEAMGAGAPRRRLLQQQETDDGANDVTRKLSIFYRYEGNSTAITDSLVELGHKVEKRIMELPGFQKICLRQEDDSCHAPFGVPTIIYSEFKNSPIDGIDTDADSVREAADSNRGDNTYRVTDSAQRPLDTTAQSLVAGNVTFFFDIYTDGVFSSYLHSVVAFAEGDDRDTWPSMFDDLFEIFSDAQDEGDGSGREVIINFGEDDLIQTQIERQLLRRDAPWAILSVILAAIMLRVGSQSTFLTVAGVFMILMSFPIAWLFYAAPNDFQYINFIHFLAPFVVLGIGLDDIFVFTSFYDTTRDYAGHFALDTRLTSVYERASGATLATSTTSAFAFAANIFSPVPAVQSFGLLLATIVVVNYLLVITWMPACLAVWDRYILQPALRRAAAGKSSGYCRCCFETSASSAAQAALARDYPAAVGEPRCLEYGRIAWPLTAPPPSHRLAAPPEFRERVRVAGGSKAAGGLRAKVFGAAFDGVWRLRWVTIPLVLLCAIAGAVGTARLDPPPTSEPPLFEKDHNVQFFYRFLSSNEANNRPECPACKSGDLFRTFRNPIDVIEDPGKFIDGDRPLLTQAEGLSSVEVDLVWGVVPGSIDNSVNAGGDPIETRKAVPLAIAEDFDFGKKEHQLLIARHLSELFDLETGAPKNPTLVGKLKENPLQIIREYCQPDPDKLLDAPSKPPPPACNDLDGETGLPTGQGLREVVFRYLANGPGTKYRKFFTLVDDEYKGGNAYLNQPEGQGDYPRVGVVRAQIVSSTIKGAAPTEVRESFDNWSAWAATQQAADPESGLFASSKSWLEAVTYTEISDSIYTTVFLSILLAGIVVFIFAGKPVLTLLATLTVLFINLTVMGILYLRGWNLGAIEGMSITSLVGLSVDFCIHMVEGHIHARSGERRGNAREALLLVGVPMVASAVSTVITTTPLFATKTLILKTFASVIAITMSVGLLYVWLFLTPLMGMFGPRRCRTEPPEDAPTWKRVLVTLYLSKAIRFIVVVAFLYLFLRFMPTTKDQFEGDGTAAKLGKMLAYLLAGASVVVITRAAIRIIQNQRALREKQELEAERAAEQERLEDDSPRARSKNLAPDQTFALPLGPSGARAPPPPQQPSQPPAHARKRMPRRMKSLRKGGSSPAEPSPPRGRPAGGGRVTSFGRGAAGGYEGPGSTPPQVGSARGYAPPAPGGYEPPGAGRQPRQ